MTIKATNMTTTSLWLSALALAGGLSASSTAAMADEEFYGVVESRPQTNLGIWAIGGRQIEVNDKTKLKSREGTLAVGACVEVEHDNGVADEIESKKPNKCK